MEVVVSVVGEASAIIHCYTANFTELTHKCNIMLLYTHIYIYTHLP